MLINNSPLKAVVLGAALPETALPEAALRPVAGYGAGAVLCEGTLAGSHAGEIAARELPRLRWAAAASAVSAVRGGHQPTSSTQFTTLIDPVAPGGLGPHPVREPEPV